MNAAHPTSDISMELERLAKLPWFESGKPCRAEIATCGNGARR